MAAVLEAVGTPAIEAAEADAKLEVAPARRRTIGGKTITVREYLLDAGARDFLVLYWVPPDPGEPVLLLNIRIGGQNRFRWKQ